MLPHTADVIVEAWAPSRAGCLEEFVGDVVGTFVDAHAAGATREIPLELGSARDEDMVVALCEDVRYLLEADRGDARGRTAARRRRRHNLARPARFVEV